MADVFISYSRKDTEFVRKLNDALAQRNHNVWVDWKEIRGGTEWWEEIITGIEGTDKFIFVISPDAIDSEYCGKEIGHAVSQNKNILPILWRSGLGNKCIPLRPAVSRHHYISFEGRDDFNQAIQELDEAIALNINLFHVHKRLLVKAIEWNNNGREESFLIRGKELESAETWLSKSADKDPKPTESQVTYIEISRKFEDANDQATLILQKAVRSASQKIKIGLAILFLTLVASVASLSWAYLSILGSEQEIAIAKTDAEIAKAQAKEEIANAQAREEIAKAQAKEEIANAQANAKIAKAEIEATSTQLKIETQNAVSESRGSASKVIGAQIKNGLVYIQVPSDTVKNRIQNLTTNLESGGYKAYIGVVGKSLSPNVSQIRYFHKGEKERVTKLQQDLIKISPEYKDFKLQYVPNFENKTRPEMMEVWFGKDAK